MDFFIDNIVKNEINRIIQNKDKLPDDTAVWKSLTKLMFKHYLAYQVYQWVYDALAESSDEHWFENKFPEEVFMEKFVEPKQVKIRRNKKARESDGLTTKLSTKISIIGIADKYGLRPLGKPKRICPFHPDKDPSLSLNDEKGLFHCFGCGVGGNLVDFVYLIRKHKLQEVNK